MFSALRHSRDRLAVTLRVALVVGAGCVFSGASAAVVAAAASTLPSVSPTGSAAQMLHFAWLRDGQSQLWQFNAAAAATAAADGLTPQSARPLPATLETPLGSVWKLFVYGYLVDRNIATPDYVCNGGDPEEVYCCMTGGHVDRDHALVQSCGRFSNPRACNSIRPTGASTGRPRMHPSGCATSTR